MVRNKKIYAVLIAAFTARKGLSADEAAQLRKMVDEFEEEN